MDAINPREDDLYIAYLPLAHVLELIGESMMIMSGVAVGYSGPNTLTDKALERDFSFFPFGEFGRI